MGGSRRTLEDVAMKEEMSERQDCPRENSVNDVAGKVRTVVFRPYLHITRNGGPLCEDRRTS